MRRYDDYFDETEEEILAEQRAGCLLLTTWTLMLLCGLLLVLLSGCGGVRYVPVESVRIERDTVVQRDTVNRYVRSESKTIEVVKDSTHVVEDEAGNIKSKERIMDRYLIIENRDSIDYYRHISDSLISVRADSIRVPYPVERKLSRWEQLKLDVGGMAMGAIAVLVVALIVVWLVRAKK